MSADHPNGPARIVSREEWFAARIALLEKEKALTVMKDALAAERRALPWVRVEKNYVFNGPTGPVTPTIWRGSECIWSITMSPMRWWRARRLMKLNA
jgi:hypothetical protein